MKLRQIFGLTYCYGGAPGLDVLGSGVASLLSGGNYNYFPIGTFLAGTKTAMDAAMPFIEALTLARGEFLNGAALDYIGANMNYASGFMIFIPTALYRSVNLNES